jgi:uncharacterized protein (TIGR02391 family)
MEEIILTEEQRLYLQHILDYWRKNNNWPTHQHLDGIFYELHSDLDIEKIGKSLSFEFTSQPDLYRPDSKATLTVPAIYLLDKNAPELATFLKMLNMCVKKYAPSSEDWISSETIFKTTLIWDESVDRASLLLRSEPHIWQSFSGPDEAGNWRGKQDRLIRRFRDITTIEGYLEKRNPFPKMDIIPSITEPVNTDIYITAECTLHPDIYEKCWTLYKLEDYDNAILNATKAIEVTVRKKSGLSDHLIGVDLMTQAFKPDKPVLTYGVVKAEQEGMMSLLRGIIGVYKNPQSHKFVGIEDKSECLGIMLMCSSLLYTIDNTMVAQSESE